MLPVLRRRISSCGRNSAHQVDRAVEQSERRRFRTLGAAMPGCAVLGARVVDRSYGRPSAFVKDAIRRNVAWPAATTEKSSAGSSPLRDLSGTITPRGLSFDRRHAGPRRYAAISWDYIDRALPFSAPHTLSANDVYAPTAYILNLNGIVDDNSVADRNGLPKVKMPYRGTLSWRHPHPDTHAKVCMKDCADPRRIEVKSTAEGKGVTPRAPGPLDEMQVR